MSVASWSQITFGWRGRTAGQPLPRCVDIVAPALTASAISRVLALECPIATRTPEATAASITAIRTAAVSGAATKLLANPEVHTLGILGSGVQAETHVAAMMAVRDFRQVLVWSRTRAHAEALVERLRPTLPAGVPIAARAHAEEVAQASDVVCTVTAAREPVLGRLGGGKHVNAVGASVRTARELDTSVVRQARLYVDRRESALNEAGDILIPIEQGAITADHIVAELGEVLIGKAPGRQSEGDLTLFKSLGLAIEDLACARYLVDEARRQGAGTWIEL